MARFFSSHFLGIGTLPDQRKRRSPGRGSCQQRPGSRWPARRYRKHRRFPRLRRSTLDHRAEDRRRQRHQPLTHQHHPDAHRVPRSNASHPHRAAVILAGGALLAGLLPTLMQSEILDRTPRKPNHSLRGRSSRAQRRNYRRIRRWSTTRGNLDPDTRTRRRLPHRLRCRDASLRGKKRKPTKAGNDKERCKSLIRSRVPFPRKSETTVSVTSVTAAGAQRRV